MFAWKIATPLLRVQRHKKEQNPAGHGRDGCALRDGISKARCAKPITRACGTIEYEADLSYPALKAGIIEHDPTAVIVLTDKLLFWGARPTVDRDMFESG